MLAAGTQWGFVNYYVQSSFHRATGYCLGHHGGFLILCAKLFSCACKIPPASNNDVSPELPHHKQMWKPRSQTDFWAASWDHKVRLHTDRFLDEILVTVEEKGQVCQAVNTRRDLGIGLSSLPHLCHSCFSPLCKCMWEVWLRIENTSRKAFTVLAFSPSCCFSLLGQEDAVLCLMRHV